MGHSEDLVSLKHVYQENFPLGNYPYATWHGGIHNDDSTHVSGIVSVQTIESPVFTK